jgi:hypothetical protein
MTPESTPGHKVDQVEESPTPTILPIHPEHGLFALVYMGDGTRFVRLFKKTWEKIPQQDRDLLLGLWKAQRDVLPSGYPNMKWPRISLRKEHGSFEGVRKKGHISLASSSPVEIAFYAPTFTIMPDDVSCTLIAHELAHGVIGLENPKKPPRGLGKKYADLEKRIDQRVEEWGFDVEAFDRWRATHQMEILEADLLARLEPE